MRTTSAIARGVGLAGLIGGACIVGVVGTAVAATTKAPTATYFNGTPKVGALFASASSTHHFCTASVVDSPAGDLILTAGHCIRGTAKGLVFVPAYDKGHEPYGAWTVTGAYGAPAWLDSGDTQDDFAFLTVAPRTVGGRSVTLESVTGANRLGFTPAKGVDVTVPAYAAGTDDRPFTCTAAVYYDGVYPAFQCHSYPDGTSGSPFLVDTPFGPTVSGVIGGLHQGGCTVLTSYTSPFGQDIWRTYVAAATGGTPDTFPAAGSDGC